MTSINKTQMVPQSPATRLRSLIAEPDSFVACPGVYDGLSARIALRAGFDCLYMTGAGSAASKLGMPDLGVMTMNDMVDHASMIASLDPTVPLIADADTGYGGPIMVARTVKTYIQRGIAGLHIEDQVQTKRCGHLSGKELVDEDIFFSRIRAAVMAREEMRRVMAGDIVIIARTDALQSFGYDVAVHRLKRCAELGADVAFLEGPTSLEQMKQVCSDMAPTPVLLNMVPGGVTPWVSQAEAQKLGFRLMIYPLLSIEAAYLAMSVSVQELKEKGDVTVSSETAEHGVKGIFGVCGLMDCIVLDQKAGGNAYGPTV